MTDAALPVVWLSRHADTICRGYWDQALLTDMLDGRWRPAGYRPVEHHEVRWMPENYAGRHAIVVVPARHHANDVDWLNEQLAPLAGVLLILTGDEEQAFPRHTLHLPMPHRVWVMGAGLGLYDGARDDELNVTAYIGSGYTPHSHHPAYNTDRRYAASFAGQNTHSRRRAAVTILDRLARSRDDIAVLPTEAFASGLSADSYTDLLHTTRVVPCPSGPASPDSFRAYEALEAGCVPLVDRHTPGQRHDAYWPLNAPGAPFPIIDRWEELPGHVERITDRWPLDANEAGAWWQGWCWELARRLRDDLDDIGTPAVDGTHVTGVITTSPVPASPDLDHLDVTIRAMRQHFGVDAPILLAVDGVRPEQCEQLGAAWDNACHRILHNARHVWDNVEVCWQHGEWLHQAGTLRRAIRRVETPVVLFCEHDTPLVTDHDLPVGRLVELVESGEFDVIRFHHEASVLDVHEHLMAGDVRHYDDVSVRPTVQWSQRPHLASTAYYADVLDAYFTDESRTMVEDTMHSVCVTAWNEYGAAGWNRHRLGLFHPAGDNIKRSYHLDARGAAPKFEMVR